MSFSLATPSAFRENLLPPLSRCTSCFEFDLRFHRSHGFPHSRCRFTSFKLFRNPRSSRRRGIACSVTEPQNGSDKQEKEAYKNEETLPSEDSSVQSTSPPVDGEQLNEFSDANKDQSDVQGGVLFKGNLRGQAAKSYDKISKRLKDKFGDEYKLFLLVNPEDDKPVAVVVPRTTLQPETTAVPEWFAAGAFGLVTVFTLLIRNVPALQSNLLSAFDNLNLLKDGLHELILGVHELGHFLAAKDTGVKLGVPYFVPSWQIGSFGAITRIRNIVPNRKDLLKVAAAGPLVGYSLGLLLLFLGFVLPPSDGLGVVVDASVFHESFLAGGIDKLQSRSALPLLEASSSRRHLLVSVGPSLATLACGLSPSVVWAEENSGDKEEDKGVIGAIKSLFDPNEKTKSGKVLPKAYLKSAREVVKTLRESLNETSDDIAKFRRTADSAKESIREYLGSWRGNQTVVQEESYVILEKVIRSLANFYSKAGPSAPLSQEVKSEILDYLNTAEEFL